MELVEHVHVAYLPGALQTFDIYVPKHLLDAPDAFPLLCFVHGGAWRSEDKEDHATLARKLAMSTGYPVALPNYRLTPKQPTPDDALQHPAHAQDICRFLEFVLSWHDGNGGRLPQRPRKLILIGHSCSAHILCTIFLLMRDEPGGVCPSDDLVRSTAAIIMSEGIYDIDLLLSSFPAYRSWFIENAFGRKDSYEYASAMKATVDPRGQHIRWFVIHSKGDTLVDERQSQRMYDFLRENHCLVSTSFDDLHAGHNDILKSSQYIEIINTYSRGVVAADESS